MPPVNASLIRDRRDELDLSNTTLAERSGVPRRYVENIVQGRDHPSRRVIHKLARALDLTVADLLVDGGRTPKGDPSEPPVQPGRPSGPVRRSGHEDKKSGSGPKRADAGHAA